MNRSQKILLAVVSCCVLACGPKGVTDQSIAADIQAKLASNDATRGANVKVAVANGVVTLSGDVPNSDAALQAMTAANSTPGIRSVSNQMKVAEAVAAAQPVMPNPVAPAPAIATPNPPPPLSPPPPPPRDERVAEERRERHEEKMRKDAEYKAEHQAANAAPPPAPVTITIPAGRAIAVRMIDGIDTGHNHEGQTFNASLAAPITDDDRVVVRAGAPATVLLAQARSSGRLKGNSELELRLTSITYHGAPIQVATSTYEASGGSRGKQSAIRTGIGAAAGALIGGLAGGGKGAGIGAAAGGGAGVGFQLLTHGAQIKIPSETEITFTLESPLTLDR